MLQPNLNWLLLIFTDLDILSYPKQTWICLLLPILLKPNPLVLKKTIFLKLFLILSFSFTNLTRIYLNPNKFGSLNSQAILEKP